MQSKGWENQKQEKIEVVLKKILSDWVGNINNGSITILMQDSVIIQINIHEKIPLENAV